MLLYISQNALTLHLDTYLGYVGGGLIVDLNTSFCENYVLDFTLGFIWGDSDGGLHGFSR